METLRVFLSAAHQRGLAGLSVLMDTEVEDPLLEERLHRIRAQVMAAVALRSLLVRMGFGEVSHLGNRLDLTHYIALAEFHGVINRREAGIFRAVNQMANEAKHELVFRARL